MSVYEGVYPLWALPRPWGAEIEVDLFRREVEILEWETVSERESASRDPKRRSIRVSKRVGVGYPYRERMALGDLLRLLWILWRRPTEFLFYLMVGRAFGASIGHVVKLMLREKRGRGSVIPA